MCISIHCCYANIMNGAHRDKQLVVLSLQLSANKPLQKTVQWDDVIKSASQISNGFHHDENGNMAFLFATFLKSTQEIVSSSLHTALMYSTVATFREVTCFMYIMIYLLCFHPFCHILLYRMIHCFFFSFDSSFLMRKLKMRVKTGGWKRSYWLIISAELAREATLKVDSQRKTNKG